MGDSTNFQFSGIMVVSPGRSIPSLEPLSKPAEHKVAGTEAKILLMGH